MKHFIIILLFSVFFIKGYSQIGGRYTYEFLNLTSSPRVAALGGKLVSHPGADLTMIYNPSQMDSLKYIKPNSDLSLVYHNPAQLDEQMQGQLSMNYVDYMAGIRFGNISFCPNHLRKYTLAYGLQYIDYGSFVEADENGTIIGSFSAAEYAMNISASMPFDSVFRIGADIRPILSSYESYKSTGLSSDLGITYTNTKDLYQMALVVRNFGTQLKSYASEMEPLPFEIQLGYTQYMRYAPFNISITAHHLETWDMSVKNDESNNLSTINGDQTVTKQTLEKVADQVMRHLIFGAEFTPFRNFYVRVGYNYQRRQELKIHNREALVGISWGFGISINRFQISYARASYHLAAASDVFAITTNLNSFYRKK